MQRNQSLTGYVFNAEKFSDYALITKKRNHSFH